MNNRLIMLIFYLLGTNIIPKRKASIAYLENSLYFCMKIFTSDHSA